MPKDLNPAERVRERIRQWMATTDLSQADFASDVGKTQVWLQKVLAGKHHVRLKDLDDLAHAMRTTASELVRSEDDRYQLELTPSEVRLVEKIRRRPDFFSSICNLLQITAMPRATPTQTPPPEEIPSRKGKRPEV